MSTDKVKIRYITAFYTVFLAKRKRIEERIEAGTADKEDLKDYESLGKTLAKIEAQENGVQAGDKDDKTLARELLEQAEKLTAQAYRLDPSLDPANKLKVA